MSVSFDNIDFEADCSRADHERHLLTNEASDRTWLGKALASKPSDKDITESMQPLKPGITMAVIPDTITDEDHVLIRQLVHFIVDAAGLSATHAGHETTIRVHVWQTGSLCQAASGSWQDDEPELFNLIRDWCKDIDGRAPQLLLEDIRSKVGKLSPGQILNYESQGKTINDTVCKAINTSKQLHAYVDNNYDPQTGFGGDWLCIRRVDANPPTQATSNMSKRNRFHDFIHRMGEQS